MRPPQILTEMRSVPPLRHRPQPLTEEVGIVQAELNPVAPCLLKAHVWVPRDLPEEAVGVRDVAGVSSPGDVLA